MTDYKNTLNLPKTDFPMRADLARREPAMLQFWLDVDLYNQLRIQNKEKPKFILHDGPPYANGHIHIGHSLNKILKDIVLKSKSLNGFNTPFVPGWDCHGLPIELNVEKQLGKIGEKISAAEFRKACREYAHSQIEIQKAEFKRLGVLADWDHPYATMDFDFEANIIRALADIVENGHLLHGSKPVYWCVDCCSALAEAEVEYKDKASPAIDVRFFVADSAGIFKRFRQKEITELPVSIPIWTTTPWTLPANQAVALHPNIEYALVETHKNDYAEFLIIAVPLVESAMQRYGISDYRIVASALGEALEGFALQHPFLDKQVPVILGDHVTIEAGTGAVHTAPAHGQEDYVVASRYDLAIDNPVNDKGVFSENTPWVAGLHVFKANEKIIALLTEKKALLLAQTIQHSYPHCWRHKTPLIYRATAQWFISMEKQGLRTQALQSIDHVNWNPQWGHARMADMLVQRPDWCISRQRLWGTPLTLFIHRETDELHPDTPQLMRKVADIVEHKGIDSWQELDSEKLLGSESKNYRKVTDALDVWFDSGVSHACVLMRNPELSWPADLYLEGSDQYRGWFQSSLLTGTAMRSQAPYKTILSHGFTVDAQGRKMSKSLGNVIAPEQVWNTLGADILRLWVASTDYRGEITVSDEILQRTAEVYRRIRNTARFLLSNLFDFNPAQDRVDFAKMIALDRWAVDRARILQEEIQRAYDGFQFHLVSQKIHHFCTVDMGSFYLDIIKDRQYTTKSDGLARRSAQTAMYYILEALVRWLAPILSFTAEEIWQHMAWRNLASVFLTQWYQPLPVISAEDKFNQAFWLKVMEVRDAVNRELEKARNSEKLGSALEAEVTLYVDSSLQHLLAELRDELRFVLITSSACVLPLTQRDEQAVATEIPNLFVKVDVSNNKKCVRCWHRRFDVGKETNYPELCSRCIENVAGKGELRHYA